MELAAGGAASSGPEATNPNLVGFSYSAGLLLDGLVMHVRSFGLSAAVGYDVGGVSYGATVDAFSHAGAGPRGAYHGPRAGLLFQWGLEASPGPSLRARPNSMSASFEAYGSEEWSTERSSPAPALWIVLGLDASL
jgi:hypothetical protein